MRLLFTQCLLFKDYCLNRKIKTLDTYLYLIETIIKPAAIYVCESWGDCDKKAKL